MTRVHHELQCDTFASSPAQVETLAAENERLQEAAEAAHLGRETALLQLADARAQLAAQDGAELQVARLLSCFMPVGEMFHKVRKPGVCQTLDS